VKLKELLLSEISELKEVTDILKEVSNLNKQLIKDKQSLQA